MAADPSLVSSGGYPEGQAQTDSVVQRQRTGNFWASMFMASTLVGILALLALLFNIVDGAFGYVAVQNEVDPASIVQEVEQARLLAASGLTTSEDDEVLAAGVAANPNAAGFFGYAYYLEHVDTLKVLSVEGVAPTIETVDSGDYPLARPLYIYTTAETLREKPQLAAYLGYYLSHVNEVIGEVGYFPAAESALAAGLTQLRAATGAATPTHANRGNILMVGSSTVFPLSKRMADDFRGTGYTGSINISNTGTRAGFAQFCTDPTIDVVNASRPISRGELEACRAAKRLPLEFRVGNDALVVVINPANDSVENVTLAQLAALFVDAVQWSDVEPNWPAEPIMRYAPGADSGTLDFFVEQVLGKDLSELPKDRLAEILTANVSAGLMRRLESEQPLAERSQQDIYELVLERVVEPQIVESWSLTDSIFRVTEIEAAVAKIPNAQLTFRSWVTADFVTSPQSSKPEFAGIRTAILGSLWTILLTLVFSLPLGVGAAIYLEEYAQNNWVNRLIETNINNLAGVPSIIYGMLGLALFVRMLESFTSGTFFGVSDPTTANGRTVISAGLTLGLLILPLIIINAREAIRAVPASLRQASYGLGATQWQTIWSHVVPGALPGILTGTILAISRAIGETAPLVVIGASTFIVVDPSGPFAKFTTLPIQIYQWTARPQAEFRNLAAAAIIILLVMLLSLNATAVILRNRFSRQRV